MQRTTNFVQVRVLPVSLGLLKYLAADFVKHGDFLKEMTQTFRQRVQRDATNVSISCTIRRRLHLLEIVVHYLFYCYCLWI